MNKIIFLLLLVSFGSIARQDCQVEDISVVRMDAKFVDKCSNFSKPCWFMGGTSTLKNGCDIPVGIQLKLTGYDKNGMPVDTMEFWPASIRNVPVGEYVFKMPQHFDYSSQIKTFAMEPVSVKVW